MGGGADASRAIALARRSVEANPGNFGSVWDTPPRLRERKRVEGWKRS